MWSNYLLLILLVICVFTDLKERKIYNKVLFPALTAALFLHVVTGGFSGLQDALLGTMAGLGLLMIPFLLGGMGAGDVKLLAVIGGIKGTGFVVMTAFYMALAGGILAIFILLFRKDVKNRIAQTVYFLHGLLNGMMLPFFEDKEAIKTTYPYGVAIAAGAICQMIRSGGFPT